MITQNMIEIWKVNNPAVYMNWVGLYGYDKAQERVIAAIKSAPSGRLAERQKGAGK